MVKTVIPAGMLLNVTLPGGKVIKHTTREEIDLSSIKCDQDPTSERFSFEYRGMRCEGDWHGCVRRVVVNVPGEKCDECQGRGYDLIMYGPWKGDKIKCKNCKGKGRCQ